MNGDGVAWANWSEFERSSPDLTANPRPALRDALEYVRNNPPMVQMARSGRSVFEQQDPRGTGNEAICELLKRIRNNLIHGGKQPYTQRDRRLVNAALEIIEGFLEADDDLRAAFQRGAR